jgi:glutathionylspermidine synthase
VTAGLRIRDSEVKLMPLAVDYPAYRRSVIFRCYKWDPQVGDVSTVSEHACVLSPDTAKQLFKWAESLAEETINLEGALGQRPDLFAGLGIPRKLRTVLSEPGPASETQVRVMRFDFHPTFEGWALSEVNSDVPGGFAESSELPKLAAAYLQGARPAGDVADAVVTAISHRLGLNKRLGLIHATSYADDRQVMQFLASRLTAAGFRCALLAPDHVRWKGNEPVSIADEQSGPVDGILRFFPAEWLPALPRRDDWRGYFRTQTLACNPARAVLSQSKRLPLVWDELGVPLPAWGSLLPKTRDPREAPWRSDEGWLVKPAFGRVGEGLAWRGSLPPAKWRRTLLSVALSPRSWVAQRRFASRPLMSRVGPRHLCIGVFTVEGKAAGFYGRLSASEVIEKHAQDVPVLVRDEAICR